MRCSHRQWIFLRQSLRSYSTVGHLHPPVKLRPYQESCLEACIGALKSGATRIGVSLPTGSGKTTVFISLVSLIQSPKENPDASRSLVIVNSIELARQTAAQTHRLFPEWTVEIEQGTKHQATGLADLTVATYQTLLRPSRLAKFDPAGLKAIIVDEAHHAAAPSYRHILSRFHSAIQGPDDEDENPPSVLKQTIPVIGFSATFSRHDGLALGSVFERIVYHRDFLEMIKEQWLCHVRFTSIRANIDLRDVTINTRSGDFNATSLSHVINTPTVNNLVVQTWLDRAATRKSTLVFCVNLAHVRDLTNAFRNAGVDARYMHAGTPATERKDLITAFRGAQFPVLLNCAILTEGADIPNIDCVVLAKPTRSRNMFAQMIGRGMRLSPDTGKEDCRIIDFVDSMNRVPGVVSVPTLFGLDPSELIDDESLEAMEGRANSVVDLQDLPSRSGIVGDVPDPKSITYTDYDDPFALVHEASGAPHVLELSRNAWVGCGGDTYILDCLGHGFIKVEPAHEVRHPEVQYRGVFTPALKLPVHVTKTLKLSPFQRSKQILLSENLRDAIKGCDTYAKMQAVPGAMYTGLSRSASWRYQPATENQKAFIRKRWEKRSETFSHEELKSQLRTMSRLTKGEAGNIIIRLKHGAQARYAKKTKHEKKSAAALAKEQQRKAREHVSIGPLSM